jgi:formylglycine-generating enzyme required for sulfatase activity
VKLRIESGGTEIVLADSDLPLPLGGVGSPFFFADRPAPLAWLGMDHGELFIQPEPGAQLFCNEAALESSHWVRAGDVIRDGEVRIHFAATSDGLLARLDRPHIPSRPLAREAEPLGVTSTDAMGIAVRPIPFRPTRLTPPIRTGLRIPLGLVLTLLALLPVALLLFFFSTSRVVKVEVAPEPDQVALRGRWPSVWLFGRFLVRPGRFTLVAEKAGYVRLDKEVTIEREGNEPLRFTMERTPGRLVVETGDVTGAEVSLDAHVVGKTPLPAFDAPPGEREIVVRAEGYLQATERVLVRGSGVMQKVFLTLLPNHALVTFDSDPAGATVSVDGTPMGQTPLTAKVGAGRRTATFALSGRKAVTRSLDVIAGSPLSVPKVSLPPADTHLTISTDPSGATVTVDGKWRGDTPVEIDVPSSLPHELNLTKAGFEAAKVRIEPGGDARRSVEVKLEALVGEVRIVCRPPDAEVFVDGTSRGRADQTLKLTATPHEIILRKAGFADFEQTVTPRPGVPQAVRATLAVVEERERPARTRVASAGTRGLVAMKAVSLGSFEMGASRREPGRRTNEVLRKVQLGRPVLLAVSEVTNAEFRRFRSGHDSGAIGSQPLNGDPFPVVRVTWEDAAAYCNWLSAQDGLTAFYVPSGGRLVATTPSGTGYRLPTEAEWERAARQSRGGESLRFSWGPALPVPVGAGNFADRCARGLAPAILEDYDDGFAGTAPVGRFAANALGLVDMAGNVAEWVHDFYALNPAGTSLPKDPLGPEAGELHVVRGSSFLHSTVSELRLTYRDSSRETRPDLGFRVARYAE